MFSLMPREKVFFELFNKSAANAHTTALALQTLLEDFTDVDNKVQRIRDCEHAGDEIAHEIYDRLAKTFITPLDREDIHDITSRLDDVTDMTDSAAKRLVLYKVGQPTEEAKALGRVLVRATSSLVEAFKLLDNLKRSEEILKHCIEVHTQENEGDRINHHALATLFENNTSPVDIIKWKDIYHLMETATDLCEDVANVIHTVVVKNA
jgi:predicted phosphate transport protein (TIGR00153 family)